MNIGQDSETAVWLNMWSHSQMRLFPADPFLLGTWLFITCIMCEETQFHFMRLVWPCITFTFTSPSVSQWLLSGRCTFHALAKRASIHSESKTWTWQFMFICKEGDIVIEVINSKRVHRWNGTAAVVAAAYFFMNSKGILKEIWSFTR